MLHELDTKFTLNQRLIY